MSMYLTTEEIVELTGKRWRSAQCKFLRENSYKFLTRADGSPVVLRTAMPRGSENKDGELLSGLEIAARSASVSKTCAVYFLLIGSEVVYVGRTINLHKRIGEHLADPNKHFDAFHYIQTSASKAAFVEEAYIKKLRPRFNLQWNLEKSI